MQLDAEIVDLLQDEFYFAIITSIKFFGPLNLKILAKVFKKSEATTSRKIKDLVKNDMLVLDNEISSKRWGKFYKLTPKMHHIIASYENFEVDVKNPQKTMDFGIVLRYISNMFNTIIEFSSYYITKLASRAIREDATLEGQQNSLNQINVSFYDLFFDDMSQMEEYNRILFDFQQKIKKFRQPHDNPKYHKFVGNLSAPLNRIHPFRDELMKDEK